MTVATRDVTNTTPAGYQSHKYGSAAAMDTTTEGAIGYASYITVEDDMIFYTEQTVSGVTLVFDDSGNWSMDAASLAALRAAGSVDFTFNYIMPSTGNTSAFVMTISPPPTDGGGSGFTIKISMIKDMRVIQ